jgi:hypothetical protein
VIYVIYVIYVIPSLRDGHIYNVQGKAMPCPVFFRSSGRVLPPLATRALPEQYVFVEYLTLTLFI